jgi:predicted transcriptional regulator
LIAAAFFYVFFICILVGMEGTNMLNIEQIRTKRKQLGLSQWALAVRVNRSGPWLGLREAGYVKPNQAELEALTRALS